jgi:hypothetical protein
MTFIGKHLPELVPFMEDTYTPQAVNQARNSFKKKVRKASATFFYGAMCGFFTTDELDDLLFEASEVARFLLEVEGTTLDIDDEIDIEDRITKVMRGVGEAAKTILKTRGEESNRKTVPDNDVSEGNGPAPTDPQNTHDTSFTKSDSPTANEIVNLSDSSPQILNRKMEDIIGPTDSGLSREDAVVPGESNPAATTLKKMDSPERVAETTPGTGDSPALISSIKTPPETEENGELL